MKKTAIAGAIILLVAIIIGGWFFYKSSQPKILGSIRYSWQTWPGVLPYLVAYDRGIFRGEGLEVEMVEDESYVEKLRKLSDGEVDFSADVVLLDALTEISRDAPLKIIAVNDYSSGADGIVAKKEIKNISDLKGKRVGVELGTVGEYLLYDALKKYHLKLSDLKIINLSAIDAAKAFIRGGVDAAVTYEPDYARAVKEGDGWRIYSSADSPGLILDVLTFNGDFTARYPEKVSAVLRSYFKALDFISENPNAAYEIGGRYFKVLPEEFEAQYAGVKQVDFIANQRMLSFGGADSLHSLIRNGYRYLREKEAAIKAVDSTEIINPRFFRALMK